jgi:hypothetical protein
MGELVPPLMRRPKTPRMPALHAYHQAFGESNAPLGDHIAVKVELAPGNEIARLSIHIPSAILRHHHSGPVARVATRRRHARQAVAPAITDLRFDGSCRTGSVQRVGEEDGGSCADVVCHMSKAAASEDLDITFLAWEVTEDMEGNAPYLHARTNLELSFPAFAQAPVVLTFVVALECEPRSIQGTHVLAYPSRTFAEQRYLNLYFRPDRPIRVSAVFGPTNDVAEVWLSFAKVAGAAGLVAFVGSLRRSPNDVERLLAVLASLATLLGLSGELLRQLSELRIYRYVRRYLQVGLLAAETVAIAAILLGLLRLRADTNRGIYGAVVPFSLSIAAVALLITLVGLVLHRVGFWHGFVCDYEGCETVLRLRRGRTECHYTGRVFCDSHIHSVCGACTYGPELHGRARATDEDFQFHAIPCRNGG